MDFIFYYFESFDMSYRLNITFVLISRYIKFIQNLMKMFLAVLILFLFLRRHNIYHFSFASRTFSFSIVNIKFGIVYT